MSRPCFLVIDPEFAGSISTRKLVIETAKLNVITAYSGTEAIETLRRFPNIDGILLDDAMRDIACPDLLRSLRQLAPHLPLIVVTSPGGQPCDGADHYLDSFAPRQLLDLLVKLKPTELAEIKQRDDELTARH